MGIMSTAFVYTDGSITKNPGGTGGWCAIIIYPMENFDKVVIPEVIQQSDQILINPNGEIEHAIIKTMQGDPQYGKPAIHIVVGKEDPSTNSRTEISAVISAMTKIHNDMLQPEKVIVYSDSEYVCNSINGWLMGWYNNNWIKFSDKQTIKNKDLWEQVLKYKLSYNIKAIHVKGHNGHYCNEQCDIYAKQASKNQVFDKPDYIKILGCAKKDYSKYKKTNITLEVIS